MADECKKENYQNIVQAMGFLNATKSKLIEMAEYELAARARDMEQDLLNLLGAKLKMPPQWTEVLTPQQQEPPQ